MGFEHIFLIIALAVFALIIVGIVVITILDRTTGQAMHEKLYAFTFVLDALYALPILLTVGGVSFGIWAVTRIVVSYF